MLGQPYEFVGLMDHLQDRGLLDTGEYFVVGVHLGQYDPLNPQAYFQGICRHNLTAQMMINTLGKSSNRSPGNFNILININNIQKKTPFFREMYFVLAKMIYQIFILINQFTQFPSREKYGYPNTVNSHLIIQFLGLKTGKITETLVFSE